MNLKTFLSIVFIMSALTVNFSFAQTKKHQNALKEVKYNDNVDAPLTAVELDMIKAVYGNTAHSNVLNKPQRLKDIKNILRNRVEIKKMSNVNDPNKYTLLSEVPLMDYYVDSLERDTNFNPEDFNPLKYLFNFYSKGSHMYRVDNTSYFIIIKSQFK